MEEKYRLLFFKYLYEKLNLKDYEKHLFDMGIECIDDEYLMSKEEIVCSKISKYFYLLNEVDLNTLSFREKIYLRKININEIDDNVINFINRTYERVLLNHSKNDKTYYGIFNDEDYEADNDAIALGFKYNMFGLAKEYVKNLEEINKEKKIVNNTIESLYNKEHDYKIKIILYSELFEKVNQENDDYDEQVYKTF